MTYAASSSECGFLEVRGESMVHSGDKLAVKFKANLAARGLFNLGGHRFSVSIARQNEGDTFTTIHRTEEVADKNDPEWVEEEIPMTVLNNCDDLRPLRFTLHDKNVEKGSFVINTTRLLEKSGVPVPLVGQNNTEIGTLTVTCRVKKEPILLEVWTESSFPCIYYLTIIIIVVQTFEYQYSLCD